MKITKLPKTKTYIFITLFSSILWIIGFFISIYNYKSIKTISYTQNGNKNIQQNINVDSNSRISSVNQYNWPVIPKTDEEIKKEELSYTAKSVVKDFYNYMNNKNFNRFYNLFDNAFKNDNNIKIYFSENRIINFLDIIDGSLKPQLIEEDYDERKDTEFLIRRWFRYNLKYEINWKHHIEVWKMILISTDKGKSFQVNSLYCEIKNCSKSPFYK